VCDLIGRRQEAVTAAVEFPLGPALPQVGKSSAGVGEGVQTLSAAVRSDCSSVLGGTACIATACLCVRWCA
jgi:hypothetical protein